VIWSLAVDDPKAPGRTIPRRFTAPQDIDIACKALQEMRQHLDNLARFGGGSITPGLLQAAADDCVEAVLVTDADAQIVMVNGAAGRLLGMSTREVQQLTVWDITHTSFQADFDVLWKEFLRAGRQRGAYTVRQKNGVDVEVAYCAQANVLPNRNISVLRRVTV
jgi:PAS domain S-box-containing protein